MCQSRVSLCINAISLVDKSGQKQFVFKSDLAACRWFSRRRRKDGRSFSDFDMEVEKRRGHRFPCLAWCVAPKWQNVLYVFVVVFVPVLLLAEHWYKCVANGRTIS